MNVFDIDQAKNHFSELLELALSGEEVVISKAGKPVARILPFITNDSSPRVPGIDKGKAVIMPDFDDPLEEFEE